MISYLIFCVLILIGYLLVEYFTGRDVPALTFLLMMLTAFIPIVNIVFLFVIVFREQEVLDFIVLKGRKK
jgi:hypothetical protein